MYPEDRRYFDRIESELDRARELAQQAKQRGNDPRPEVEIPVAKDMADRVENLLGIDGIAGRIRTLETETDLSREEIALELVADFVDGSVGDYETDAGKIEGAVRTAVALLTEGVVAAPIEGIDRVTVDTNDDGSSFVTIFYAGPIRSAGGTAQALSVLVADYARSLLGIDQFHPREAEIERYAEEVALYDDETGLQYSPKDKETAYIVNHCPIMLDGEATGEEEVSGYRDLERIDTNSPRGGMCLVLAEGIALKAPKIKRYTDTLDEVAWPWLDELIDGTVGESTSETDSEVTADDEVEDPAATGPVRVESNEKYLRDLIAGRPVFGHPSAPGGFRLRYGRTRNLGHATAGIHPATMRIVDDFLAPGTQIKTELPGKAAGIVPVDSIEGPTVKLANGEIRRIDDAETAARLQNGVEAIIDLGEYLVNYGEFVENNHPLAPASYTVEWWQQELAASGADIQALADDVTVDLHTPDPETALQWAQQYDAPLHPVYTYLWHDLTVDELQTLTEVVSDGELVAVESVPVDLEDGFEYSQPDVLALSQQAGPLLETLLVEHVQTEAEVFVPVWRPLVRSLGFSLALEKQWEDLPADTLEWPNAMRAVNAIAPMRIRERAPTRVGNRMGRPEKSEVRELSPAVHTLFPIGDAGGDQRDVAAAATHTPSMQATRGEIDVDVGIRYCTECDTETYWPRCPDCGSHIEPQYTCPDCSRELSPDESGRVYCQHCETEGSAVDRETIDLNDLYRSALSAVGERENAFEILKGVKGLSSSVKTPEPLEKGILRAKHDVSVFKDGTVRYDMTDLPVTSVTPAELNVSAAQFRELGYTEDIHGDPLRHDDQLVELNVQDIVLSKGAAEQMYKTANFVDDLLVSYYDLEPYYELEEPADIVGELVFGMAPHTSAAVVGRVVGVADVSAGYAHPYFHAAKRRNCFHPETKLWYENENGQWRYRSIESLVEPRLEDPETDDFGTKIQHLDGTVRVPSLDDSGTLVTKPVSALSKHRSPDHMVQVQTQSGRSITVTPDHTMQTYENGNLTTKRASELTESDTLVSPDHIPVETTDATESHRLDLLQELLASDSIRTSNLLIRGLSTTHLYTLFATHSGTAWDPSAPVPSIAAYFGLAETTVAEYLAENRFPAGLLDELVDSRETLLGVVPEDVSLEYDGSELDRFVELNPRVATLLGYYAAVGTLQNQTSPQPNAHGIRFCGLTDERRVFLKRVFEDEFDVDPQEGPDASLLVPGRLIHAVFDAVFECGQGPTTKAVPQWLFDAREDAVTAYLRGYFSTSSLEPDPVTIETTTASVELKEDLLALLTRVGISAEVTGPTPGRPTEPSSATDPAATEQYTLRITAEDARQFAERVGFAHAHLSDRDPQSVSTGVSTNHRPVTDGSGQYRIDPVDSVDYVTADCSATYSLTVPDTHSVVVADTVQKQCDGDEDCVMLLLDGLLNFSKSYLPDKRGGSMDAPLVMSSRIDPAEIDDEAHNIDTMETYPMAFYEATRELAHPDSVAEQMTLAGESVGTDDEYRGFEHTHETSDIAAGPDLSAYKTLGSMTEKMDAQLQLARQLRAVDETDVAERVIEYHFLPDLLGNLRAFSRQAFRCLDCGTDYRRPPLTGSCRGCGGDVTLTVHEGSVTKYLDTAITIAEEYGAREYTKQRLEVLKRSIERIFEDDTNRQTGIADFM